MNKIGWIIMTAVIAGGLGFLIFGRLEKNIVYFLTPSELLAKGETAVEQPVRLGGEVQKGSILWEGQGGVQFRLTDGKKEVPVSSAATPPQMFQEEMGVVVEGELASDGRFRADRLMVKHSNAYHPPKEGEKPHLIYKELVEE